jgi:hypothetical protein
MPTWNGAAPSGSVSSVKVLDAATVTAAGFSVTGTQLECGSGRPPPSMPSDKPVSADA